MLRSGLSSSYDAGSRAIDRKAQIAPYPKDQKQDDAWVTSGLALALQSRAKKTSFS
jgi:hypothetical protein